MLCDAGELEHQRAHDEPNQHAPSQKIRQPHPVKVLRESLRKPTDGQAGADQTPNVDGNGGWKGPCQRLVIVKGEDAVNKMGHETCQPPHHAPQEAKVDRWQRPHACGPGKVKHGAVEAACQAEPNQ